MDKKDLEKLLMRFSHLGVTHSKNGALLIGKAPHIAEFAWLNIMYPCITEAEVCDLEKKLGCAIPEVYRAAHWRCTVAGHHTTDQIWIHGIRLILKIFKSTNVPRMPHRKCSFLPPMIMTVQSFILILRIIRYTIVVHMMQCR